MTVLDQYNALPESVQAAFRAIAAKSDEWSTGYQVFFDEIPAAVRGNADAVKVILDGGTAQVSRVVGDRGAAGGGYTETETIEFPDRDASRHISGKNGGEYSADNVTFEDASINRARGSENMTQAEVNTAEASLEADAEILSNADVITPAGEIPGDVIIEATPVTETGSLLGDVLDTASEAVLPIVFAFKGAKMAADACTSDEDKLGYGALAAGAGAWLGTTAVGGAVAAVWGTWCIAKLGYKAVKRFA